MATVKRHEWQSKRMIYPDEKIIKACKYCGAIYRPGENDNNLCGGARAFTHVPKLEKDIDTCRNR